MCVRTCALSTSENVPSPFFDINRYSEAIRKAGGYSRVERSVEARGQYTVARYETAGLNVGGGAGKGPSVTGWRRKVEAGGGDQGRPGCHCYSLCMVATRRDSINAAPLLLVRFRFNCETQK